MDWGWIRDGVAGSFRVAGGCVCGLTRDTEHVAVDEPHGRGPSVPPGKEGDLVKRAERAWVDAAALHLPHDEVDVTAVDEMSPGRCSPKVQRIRKKEGSKEGRKEGSKEGRKEGRKVRG